MQKINKIKKLNIFYLCVIILMLFTIGYLLFTNASLIMPKSDIVIGEQVCIKLKANESSSTSLSVSGRNLPNNGVFQSTKIIAPVEQDVIIRGTAYFVNSLGNKTNVNISTFSNWIKGQDGFYYYNKILKANTITWFSEKIQMPESTAFPLESSKNYQLIISIESLTFDNFENVWDTIPSEALSELIL